MSTGTVPPAPAPTSTPKAKKNKKKKRSPSILEIAFANFWKLLVGFVVLFLLVSSLFHGGGDVRPEPFNSRKVSQVPRVWDLRAWEKPQQEVRVAKPSLLTRTLHNIQVKLQNELESIPQDTEDREWRYKPWHGPIPQRREPQPFQLYSPDCERQ